MPAGLGVTQCQLHASLSDICNSNLYNIVHNIIQYARVSQLLLQYVQYNNIEQYHTILKTILNTILCTISNNTVSNIV